MSSKIYVGTKAFALRGTLLDPGTVQKLAEAASLDELVNRLKGTPYSDAISGLSPPYTARRMELALRERLATVHNSIIQGAGKYGILELYYLKNIAWDLKLALKARALNRTFEETAEFLDMKAEELVGRRDLIVKILSARDIAEAVAGLSGTEFHADVEKALASYTARSETRFFDLYIDHAVLSAISREYSLNSRIYAAKAANANGVKDIVALDIDGYNVLSVLRARLWGLPEAEVNDLVVRPTRRVAAPILASMAGAESTEEAVKLFEASYRFQVQGAQNEEDLIDMIEDGFAMRLKQTSSLAFVWQGLGPGAALALVKLLEFEVSNLAAIAIGVEAGIEPKKILSKLRI
ncbi:MAG: V-type ATPase subunit [Nitrososphaerales archaeon]